MPNGEMKTLCSENHQVYIENSVIKLGKAIT